MNLKKLAMGILCLCLALFSTMANAQNKELTGTVTDSKDGTPVIGASVIGVTSSGKKIGTATNAEGTFRLSSAETITKISLSGIGHENMDVNVSGQTNVAISMKASSTSRAERGVRRGP